MSYYEEFMKKEEKAKLVSGISEYIQNSNSMLFTDFSGLTVEQVNELRKEFRKANIDYKVSKNTLIKRALDNVENSDKIVPYLKGPTGIVFGHDDPIEPIKILKKFIEKNNKPSVKVIYIEKLTYPGDKLEELSKLPSKKDLYGSILGCIVAPISGVPTVIQSVIGELVNVIDAIEKKKAETGN
jgi:large subunit ribosomal protein L10